MSDFRLAQMRYLTTVKFATEEVVITHLTEADERMMDAVPDLVAALEKLLDHPALPDADHDVDVDAARAALRKARGES